MIQWILKMKLFYDARYIRTDFHDGISRYSTELGNALAKLTDVTFIVSDKKQLERLHKGAKFVLAPAPSPLTEPSMSRLMNKYNPDVVFSPLQTFGTAGRKFKLILTSHDMIYYHYRTPPEELKIPLKVGWFLYHLTPIPQRLSLNQADMVATVSHTVQREFEKHKLTKRPIIVIPNAPQKFTKYPVVSHGAPKNIIYMGSFMPYKNTEVLIEGMKWLPGRTLHLLSKITPERKKELVKLVPKGAHVVFHGGVSDDEYEKMLASNAVLATGSFIEGFGIPVAEALAMGVPAVVSNIPVFHEVAAGGAVYFDPLKPKDFADKVKTLDQKSVRDDLVKNGKQHIETFNWDRSAQALLNAINSLL